MDIANAISKRQISRADYHRFNSLRNPAPRWKLDADLVSHGQRRGDESSRAPEKRRFDEFALSHAFHMQAGIARAELESRLLVYQSVVEVAPMSSEETIASIGT